MSKRQERAATHFEYFQRGASADSENPAFDFGGFAVVLR